MSNPFREKLNKGQVCAGVLTSMPSTNTAQILSNSGFDWLFIDIEHGGRTRVFSKYLTVKTIIALY